MTFSDVFKSNFLEKAVDFSFTDVMLAFVLALIVGIFIFMVYKKTFSGVMYSSSFGLTLIAMTLITTLIILAVTSNIILSLGMVGALSIVRFRTAIKEPIEIAYLFWAISGGIVLGAGLIPLAVIGTVFIGIILIILSNKKTNEIPYIVVVSCLNDVAEKEAMQAIINKTKKYIVKAKTVTRDNVELTLEVRLKENSSVFINEISNIEDVRYASLVTYNGEYMS